MTAELDLTDPLIRRMAEQNHVPRESWALANGLVSVGCQMCGHRWPCPTRKALYALIDDDEEYLLDTWRR